MCFKRNAVTLCVYECLLYTFSADEEFDELCFEFGIELDEVVRSRFKS